jgi:hypothetical protein
MLKRARGFLLRLVLKRTVAIVLGIVLLAPAISLLVLDLPWNHRPPTGWD